MAGSDHLTVERAGSADVADAEALLAAAGLPLEGAAEALIDLGVVARSADGGVAGAAAVERFGEAGLLRSVVVAPQARGVGLGERLVRAAEDAARAAGISALYLVTESAIEWFPRLGYEPLPREEAVPAVGGSIEFTMACSVSGVVMRRVIA
ncbi:MAG: GNAT family N-acetyltransferase [Chloroflexota bacterium]